MRESCTAAADGAGNGADFRAHAQPLSRTQLLTVRFPSPPEPAVAASAPTSAQSIGLGIPRN
jgi:hypothetical protein